MRHKKLSFQGNKTFANFEMLCYHQKQLSLRPIVIVSVPMPINDLCLVKTFHLISQSRAKNCVYIAAAIATLEFFSENQLQFVIDCDYFPWCSCFFQVSWGFSIVDCHDFSFDLHKSLPVRQHEPKNLTFLWKKLLLDPSYFRSLSGSRAINAPDLCKYSV